MAMLGAECSPCCKKPCGAQTSSGGAGVTVTTYEMPEGGGTVSFRYQAFNVPDRFTVYSESETFFDTGSPVSGEKTVDFYKPHGVTSVSVRVEGPSGTAWNYTLGCPEFCNSQKQPPDDCPGMESYSYGPVFNNVPQNQEILDSRQTITVPDQFTLPVLVRGCGSCDDGFAINGIRVANFDQNMSDTVVNERTFTIGTWNDGGPAVCGMVLCFFEQNPLP